MSITKGIIDLMGGTIEVLTAPGNGTEVIVRLKFRLADQKDVQESDEGSGQKNVQKEDVDFTGKRALLVEDNMINMEIAKMILEQAGFTVETAENGKIATEMVSAAEADYYDVILMDIQMPVMDGYEATRMIRSMEDQRKAVIPVIAMTANAFQEDIDAAEKAGMQGHIAKPVDISILMQTLAEVLFNS